MLAVITYLWSPDERSHLAAPYAAADVERLREAVARNLTVPHEFICVTDHPEVFNDNPHIRAVKIDTTIPMHAGHCVCRLMTFHPDGRRLFGADHVFQMDLDTVVIRNFDNVVARKEDTVLWRNPARIPFDRPMKPRPYYNGSFVLHRCGSAPWVWREYLNLLRAMPTALELKDDQTWLSHCFGANAPYWDHVDGIYRVARPGEPETGIWGDLPETARLVTFPGSEGKADNPRVLEANPWIKDYVA